MNTNSLINNSMELDKLLQQHRLEETKLIERPVSLQKLDRAHTRTKNQTTNISEAENKFTCQHTHLQINKLRVE
jgi:hypothetical protein